jgi:DNA-binding response OmpR family regulator
MNKKVLLIEDDLISQKVVKCMLEKAGYQVDISGTAKEGLDKIHNNYLVVLTDLGLPDMDGFELIQQLRNVTGTAIVALTGRAEEYTEQKCLQLGCKEVLIKPLLMASLLNTMSSLHAKA